MGSALAANLVARGHELVTHDLAGSANSPEGATFLDDLGSVSRRASIVVLSLPDGAASLAVATAIAAAPGRTTTFIVDTSTVGLEAAAAIDATLAGAGIGYVDAPVSGGPAGAKARTLTVMYAGPSDARAAVTDVLEGLSDRLFHVGDRAGMGQAVKLANNFLSATALAATSEAVAFGASVGLEMGTLLEVLNASSGRSAATQDKFVNHVLTDSYSSGFANTLMAKDVALYLEAAHSQRTPTAFGSVAADTWSRFAATQPDADFTRIYPFITGEAVASARAPDDP
jgi:3-hydroxyisobutyrate dehydrogenase-like beta-hydroxyacid dehydrogenase